ncbi:hypothetical protein BC940DRAFT_301800 [Gongronella butleri]|nr:hypothetical protein BC940DRAFT_301800 [Gongronella butleri]
MMSRRVQSTRPTRPMTPLTEENICKMNELSDSMVSLQQESIRRYYGQSGEQQALDRHLPVPTPTALGLAPPPRPRRQRKTSKDIVMESPRSATFPYHNDDHFLPTAERAYTPAAASVRQKNGSISSQSIYSQRSCITSAHSPAKYEPLATVPRRASSAPPQPPRRTFHASTPSILHERSSVIDHFVSKLSGLFSSKKRKHSADHTSQAIDNNGHSSKQQEQEQEALRAAPTPYPRGSIRSTRTASRQPVWFTQYSMNPPPPKTMVMTAA